MGRPRNFDRDTALKCAMQVFWERGYAGASLTDLTTAMGINPPSLYGTFASKEALYLEAMELYSRTVGMEIWATLDMVPTAKEAIAGFLMETARAYSQPDSPRGCLIALGGLHHSDMSESLCVALSNRRAESIAVLRRRLERGVADGQLPQTVDVEAVATFYATVQNGMSILARDGGSYEALKHVADGAMAAWDPLTRE